MPDSDSTTTQYLEASTIHGLRYISPKEGSITDRLVWAGLVVAQFVLAFKLIWDAFVAWQLAPGVSKLKSNHNCS